MKTILNLIITSFIALSLNGNAGEMFKVESKTIILSKKSPITLRTGVYTDGQVQSLFRAISQHPETAISQQPSIVFDLDDPATIETPNSRIAKVQLSKGKSSYNLSGTYEDLASKEKLNFKGTLNAGEWLLTIKGDRAIVLSVTKVQNKTE